MFLRLGIPNFVQNAARFDKLTNLKLYVCVCVTVMRYQKKVEVPDCKDITFFWTHFMAV